MTKENLKGKVWTQEEIDNYEFSEENKKPFGYEYKSPVVSAVKYCTIPLLITSGVAYLTLPEYRDITGYAALASLAPPLVAGGALFLAGAAEAFSDFCDIDVGL